MTEPGDPQGQGETTPTQSSGNPLIDHWRRLPRRTATIALTVLPIVALGNVAVLIYALGGIDISEKLKQPSLLALVACLVFVPMFANSLRLALWARFLGVEMGFVRALKVITGTMATNSVTPSATGGMPIKLLFLMNEGVGPRRSVTLISFQAAEDSAVLAGTLGLCLSITGFAMFEFFRSDPELLARLDGTLRTVSMVVLGTLVALALVALVIGGGLMGHSVREWAARMIRRVKGWIAQIAGDWAAVLKRGKGTALVNLILSSLQWIVRFSIAGLILAAFGVEWQPALFWLLQYLVQSIAAIVPTPGGAGGAEAAFLLLFAPFVEISVLVPAMSTWRLMHFYLPLVGAALMFFLLHRRDQRRAKRAREEGDVPAEAIAQPAE